MLQCINVHRVLTFRYSRGTESPTGRNHTLRFVGSSEQVFSCASRRSVSDEIRLCRDTHGDIICRQHPGRLAPASSNDCRLHP